ncbi:MAG: c-type cytochrome [Siphonobacter sp.]
MKLTLFLFLICLTSITWVRIQEYAPSRDLSLPLPLSDDIIPADQSIQHMKVEEGFQVQLVAAEPLVVAPVTISFDAKGRIWVVEMAGFMNDTLGTGEEKPTGKIVILTDTNQDGVMDKREIFLDSLVLPRAICFIENGVLVAEPPSLWYYEIVNDRPGKRTLVDANYAQGGNVEHQPNGLIRALDNWIYNAKSDKRYRKQGDHWLIEKTHFRGQWGISQDNDGRLYYNHNSQNVIADYFLPGYGAGNAHQQNNVAGYNVNLTRDNRVYPIHPTPGVNRGYMNDVLNAEKHLLTFTAACGPTVYRGDLFGPDYQLNIFVAEPSANLIKRNLLQEAGYRSRVKQAYQGKEFLASTDERFRPVSISNSPDGALYVVDMYRGILQHKTYLTAYLKGQIAKRQLTMPLNCGRIYRIVPRSHPVSTVTIPKQTDQLVTALASSNGWIRDYAQQTLIDRHDLKVVPTLRQVAISSSNPLQRMHALWALEGLHSLHPDEVTTFLKSPIWALRQQGLGVLPNQLTSQTLTTLHPELMRLVQDTLSLPYLAYLSGEIRQLDEVKADQLMKAVLLRQPDNQYVSAAVISTFYNQEETLQQKIATFLPDTNLVIYQLLKVANKNAALTRTVKDPLLLTRQYPKGAELFNTICQTCHGKDGNGVSSLAPPLNRSEWVTGNKNHLISIVLYGLTGPVTVNKHLYQAPEITADMPGIGYDASLSNEAIAQLLNFIRKSWQNNGDTIQASEIATVRKRLSKRAKAFTVAELNRTK